MFSMSKGSVKLQQAPFNRGWYIVTLNDVIPGSVNPADPRLAGFQTEMNAVVGRELAQQMRSAIRKEVGVKRNEPAIRAVGAKLLGN